MIKKSPAQLTKFLLNIGNPHVLVVGDFMLDNYVYGTVGRISPEAPVPVLKVTSQEIRPGGAALVAMDLLKLGAKVTCLGVVGNDDKADMLRKILLNSQVDIDGLISVQDRPTTIKQRIVGLAQQHHRQQLMRIDDENDSPLNEKMTRLFLHLFEEKVDSCQIICLQDYNKGVLTPAICNHIIEFAKKTGKVVLVDPWPVNDWEKYKGANLIKPNRREAGRIAGFEIQTTEDKEKAAELIQRKLDIDNVVLTLDSEGIYLKEGNQFGRQYRAVARDIYDVTGAGDMVLAILAVGLASGSDYDTTVQIANIAAGIKIEKFGSATVDIDEIINWIDSQKRIFSQKSCDIETLLDELRQHRKQNKKIVFANGCFDILHRGHIEYLNFCKKNGDILVVGLNSDDAIKQIKGADRPINNQVNRAAMLEALEAVDYVIVFDDYTPFDIIKQVKPDILVKGEDWADKKVVGKDYVESYGGKVLLASFIEGLSTTGIIKRIQLSSHLK